MASIRAVHRFARISPTKIRPFADMIRGMSAEQGLNALAYEPNRGARFIERVLKSAIANAEDRGVRSPDRLRISEARVDGGPMFKRVHARAPPAFALASHAMCARLRWQHEPSATPTLQHACTSGVWQA